MQFGVMTQDPTIFNLAFPMQFDLISYPRDLFDSRHHTFVHLGQRISDHVTDVTKREEGMSIPGTAQNSDTFFVSEQKPSTPK
jgi:hypothetical protein